MRGRHPSAWEMIHGEGEVISYWKYRVRRLESLLPMATCAAFVVGFGVCAFFVYLTR